MASKKTLASKETTKAGKATASPAAIKRLADRADAAKPEKKTKAVKPAKKHGFAPFDPNHVRTALGVPAKREPTLKEMVASTQVKAPKRTVAVPETGLAGVPVHEVHDVAGLMKVLSTFPRGCTYTTDIYQGMSWMKVYNLRGRLIAEVKKVDKPAKAAKK